MKSALIGSTGFVGSNLLGQTIFSDTYNSKNIHTICGKTYDLVVCAAAPGVKWLANKHPDADWISISNLIKHLKTIRANRFVLISTVDVYDNPVNVDETTTIDPQKSSPYGRHRFLLEQFIAQTFPTHTIVRLPGIFGEGIKKNVIFDFIYDHEVEKINPKGQFQFYSLKYLWSDIQKAMKAKVKLLNITTEPVRVSEVYQVAMGKQLLNQISAMPVSYDVHSIHASLYGGSRYMRKKELVLKEIAEFISAKRSKV